MATPTAINVTSAGAVNFTASAPIQRTFTINASNPAYLRNSVLSQDCITFTYYTSSVVIPLTNLYGVVAGVVPQLTYAPIILTQPTGSQTVVHPTSSFFFISASAETSITYQWFSQSFSQSLVSTTNYYTLSNGGPYTGSTTAALTHSFTSTTDSSSSYLCVASNIRGSTTSSISTLYVL